MKRTLLTLFLVAVAGTVIWLAVSKKEQKPNRYYVGIGTTLYEVQENTLSFGGIRDGKTIQFNNEKGQFTRLIAVDRLLENGPAERAGLENSDILVEVDGESAKALGAEGVTQKITAKSVGQVVNLRVRRTDTEGNILREFTVDVALEPIDRVSWLPMDTWMSNRIASCGAYGSDGCDYDLSLSSMVHEEEGYVFVYTYKAQNSGKKTLTVNWDGMEFKLKPGESSQQDAVSDDFPVYVDRRATVKIYEDGQRPFAWWLNSLTGYGKLSWSAMAFVPADRVN